MTSASTQPFRVSASAGQPRAERHPRSPASRTWSTRSALEPAAPLAPIKNQMAVEIGQGRFLGSRPNSTSRRRTGTASPPRLKKLASGRGRAGGRQRRGKGEFAHGAPVQGKGVPHTSKIMICRLAMDQRRTTREGRAGTGLGQHKIGGITPVTATARQSLLLGHRIPGFLDGVQADAGLFGVPVC